VQDVRILIRAKSNAKSGDLASDKFKAKREDNTSDKIEKTTNGCLMVFFGLVVTVVGYIIVNDRHANPKLPQVRRNIAIINRVQAAFIEDSSRFAKTFDKLAIATIRGGSTATSENFQYKLDIRSNGLAIVGAKPLDRELYGFNGAILRSKNANGVVTAVSIICRSQSPGVDGTDPAQTPIADTTGMRCADGWYDILAASQHK
jgi:Type IV pilin-like G and H, putative